MRSATGHSTHDRHCGYHTAGFEPDRFNVSEYAAGKFAGSSAVHDQSNGDSSHAPEHDFSAASKCGIGEIVRGGGSLGDCVAIAGLEIGYLD